jgi:hypothetical protein
VPPPKPPLFELESFQLELELELELLELDE